MLIGYNHDIEMEAENEMGVCFSASMVAIAMTLCVQVDAVASPVPATDEASKQGLGYGGKIPLARLDAKATDVFEKLKREHGSYAQARIVVTRSGWKPVTVKECLTNIVGDYASQVCTQHPEEKDCHICSHFPELESCGGESYCFVQFKNPGSPFFLSMTTDGKKALENGDADVYGVAFNSSPGN